MSSAGYDDVRGFAGVFECGNRDGWASLIQRWRPLRDRRRFRRLDDGLAVAAPPHAIQRCGATVSAVHGRIDNIETIRAAFDPGAPLPAAALSRWGAGGLKRFRGAFAIASWDSDRQALLLAPDALGLRAIFYAALDGVFAFATDLRDILSLPGISRDLNDESLAAFISDVVPRSGATLYAAIHRVPPGCCITVTPDGEMALSRYWEPDWNRELAYARDDQYVEEARALLDQAVARQMHGPGPVVCQLSGGFDSGAVAATAARLRPTQTIHALTSVPAPGAPVHDGPRSIADESMLASATAGFHPNIAWQALSSGGLHALDDNPLRTFATLSAPARNAMNIGWLAPTFDKARALGASALLTGNFGNMTLSWGGLSGVATWVRRGRWARAAHEAASLGRSQGVSTGRMLMRHGVKPLLSPRLQAQLAARRGIAPRAWMRGTAINPDFAAATRLAELRLDQGHDYPGDTIATRRHWLSRIQNLPSPFDALGTLMGIEIRDPTADLDLLEFCFSVPDEQYLRNGQTRWLARRALADRLPAEVLGETRRGFQCADFMYRMDLQRDRIIERLEALERSPSAARALDLPTMRRLADDWPRDGRQASFAEYGAILHRGVHVGEFLRWMEGGNQ